MNPERLLQQFDRITDSPDSIPRLRRFILDLAVRGKLVEQNPNDETASQLLQRIQAEKARLVKEGRIRKQDALRLVAKENQPFLAPAGWFWERLANLSRKIHYGFTASADKSIKAVRLLRITDIQNNAVNWDLVPGCEIADEHVEQFKLEAGDILIARTGGTIGKTFLVSQIPVIAVFASYLIRVQGSTHLCYQYLKCFFESSVYWKQLEDEARGAGQPNVNGQALGRMMVPLPPLAEQQRIVAKVDELMGLCDRLETEQAERERQRDRLVAQSLHRLNRRTSGTEADEPDDFRAPARFYFNHLSSLTTRPEHIKQLRQTILNLAVRGKLVSQDASDEPALELVNRIQAEKRKLVKKGVLNVDKALPRRNNGHKSGELPSGWLWVGIQEICTSVTDGDHIPPPKSDSGIPFLVIGNVRSKLIQFDGCRYVLETYYRKLDEIRRPSKGDVLYTLVGSYGIPVVVRDDRPFCIQRHIGIIRPSVYLNVDFVALALESTPVFEQATQMATGIAQKTVPLAGLRRIQIPLPPLAEQHRIVAKVDELMALCAQLEAQLTATKDDSRRLLEAVLHEALHSTGEREV